MFTMLESRVAMNVPQATAASTHHLRGISLYLSKHVGCIQLIAGPFGDKVRPMTQKLTGTELSRLANQFRAQIIHMIMEAKSGHPGGSLSAIDLLTSLWFNEMRGVDPASSQSPTRDRFVLSKGHGV